MILGTVYEKMKQKRIFDDNNDNFLAKLVLNTEDSTKRYPEGPYDPFSQAVASCKLRVAARLTNQWVIGILQQLEPQTMQVQLRGQVIQVIDNIHELKYAQLSQQAALVRQEQCMIIWSEGFEELIRGIEAVQQNILSALWSDTSFLVQEAQDLELKQAKDEKTQRSQVQDTRRFTWFNKSKGQETEVNVNVTSVEPSETGSLLNEDDLPDQKRKMILVQPFIVACTHVAICAVLGVGLKNMLEQYLVDGKFVHFALLAIFPLSYFFAMFSFQSILTSAFQLFGPVGLLTENTKTYSGAPSRRLRQNLPHVTIQCPVYKESLAGVIDPTIQSLRKAIATYELQGGSASIFINDDGLQLCDDALKQLRIQYYDMYDIGWVARPKHGHDGFVRAGRFKKASNMNYALNISKQVELEYLRLKEENENSEAPIKVDDVYNEALDTVLERCPEAWAAGNIRIGSYILIVDSDTRIPEDCLLDAVSEMEQSPAVAVLQQASGVMQVVFNYWENGITYFTEIIYRAIKYSCSTGDAAAFVGHNAYLRWSALQEVEVIGGDGRFRYWSESHVSEDFELSMKLQTLGYVVRLAAYNPGYLEGVSLTVYDEITRWEKYAYGCSELIFNPIRYWPTRGPITKLLRTFLMSNIKGYTKFGVFSYMGTYFALGISWIFTVANYFATGWFLVYLDKAYVQSFKIYFFIIVVFTIISGLTLVIYRYRTKETSLFRALFEFLKWIPFMTIFFSGIQLHICRAIFCHLFSINIQWGATAKELNDSNMWQELPFIGKRYWKMWIFLLVLAAGMTSIAFVVPEPFQIRGIGMIYAWWPLANFILGSALVLVLLNPQLMRLKW